MAHLIPPFSGEVCAIVLTKDEALTVLATLSANPTHSNAEVRRVLGEYIDRVPA